jgi:teichuronic acid biosynthesis glycosyltransferase TuaH
MAAALTRHARVLWVDPPVSALTPASRRGDVGWHLGPRLRPVGAGIDRLSPVGLPGLTRPGIRASTGPLVRAQVRRALRRSAAGPQAVVATHLDDVLGRWDGAVSVLYATDDYVAGAGLMGLDAGWLRDQERRALARADLVVAASPWLAEHWAALGADPLLIPNGCSVNGASHAPPAAVGLPPPVVGLVGQLSERIDPRILDALVNAGCSLLLVGPRDERWQPRWFAALAARRRVRHIGRVPAEQVPGYLAAIDVGITPYADSQFNRASFPLKTLEYLAAGLPVVSTSLPASRWLRGDLDLAFPKQADRVLALADSPADFASAVHRMADAQSASTAELCRAFAARHSWQQRADALAAAIGLI